MAGVSDNKEIAAMLDKAAAAGNLRFKKLKHGLAHVKESDKQMKRAQKNLKAEMVFATGSPSAVSSLGLDAKR